MNFKNITDIEVSNINIKDYPDFVDAFISYAVWKDSGQELTDEELNELNEKHSDFVYECVMEQLY